MKKSVQKFLQRASEPHLANEQSDGDEKCEREAGDDGVIHRRYSGRGEVSGREGEKAGWERYAVGIIGLN